MREAIRRARVVRVAGVVRVACVVLAAFGGGAWLAHVLLGAWAMAARPDRFSDGWYAVGGLRRTIQILVADVLGPRGVLAVAALVAVAFVGSFTVASRHFARASGLRFGPPKGRVSRRIGGIAVALSVLAVACLAARSPRVSERRALVSSSSSLSSSSTELAPSPPSFASTDVAHPNVVLIGALGLRFDRLDPRTTPNLVRFAGTSVRFDRAYASTPRPAASWEALLSGRDPGCAAAACEDVPRGERETDTLLSRFAHAGYRVLPPIRHQPEVAVDPRDVTASAVDALDALRATAPEAPFFLTVRLASTTPPLLAPSSDRASFTDPAYRGPFKYAARGPTTNLDARDLRQWHALYDAAAFAEDAAIGRLLDALDARGLADRTIVAVVSTHGELPFGAPSTDPAGDAAVHVPWMIRAPGQSARTVSEIARDVDFAPTLHELAGVPPPPGLDGASLAPAFAGRPVEHHVAWSTLADAGRDADACMGSTRVVRDERFILVHRSSRMGATCTLFDGMVDPSHTTDVSARFPEEARRLRDALSRGVRRDPSMEERDGLFVPRASPPSPLRDVVWIDLVDASETSELRAASERGVVFPRTYAVTLDAEPAEIRAMLSGAPPRDLDRLDQAPTLPGLLRGRGYEAHAFVSPSRRSRLERALGGSMDVHEAPSMASDVERFFDEHASTPTFALFAPEGGRARETVDSVLHALERRGMRERTVVAVTVRPASRLPSGRVRVLTAPTATAPTTTASTAPPTEASMRGSLLVSAPGVLPDTGRVDARVRTIDVVPTITELLGIEGDARTSGRSLVRLARGEPEPFERVVFTETVDDAPTRRHSRAVERAHASRVIASLVRGHHHYLTTSFPPSPEAPPTASPRERLYDLDRDPLERADRSRQEPDVTAEMRARLLAARAGVRVPGDPEDPRAEQPPRTVRLRFAGGDRPRRISGTIFVGDRPAEPGDEPAIVADRDGVRTTEVLPVGVGREALRVDGDRIELSFATTPSSLVGIDLVLRPGARPIRWTFFLDDRSWPPDATFAGPFGLRTPELRDGLVTPSARFAAEGRAFPAVDTRHETGLFVVR